MKSPFSSVLRRGFSLVELLTVIALMSCLMVATKPALSFLATGGKFKNSVSLLSQTMELARQHAISKNTYTWVVLAADSTVSGPAVQVGFIESKTGVDPTSWTGGFSLPTTELVLAAPVTLLEGVTLGNISSGTQTSPSLPSSSPDGLAASAPAFSASKAGKTIAFERLVQFTPGGEAKVGAGMSDYIGLRLVSATRPADAACLIVNGLTGATTIHWPTGVQ